ncbi:MAG: glycine cleavage system protein H, partial [Saprospiraceae bacterium]
IESNKAANDISMPLSGEIIAINQQLTNNPIWLNETPYDKGWLVKIKAGNPSEWATLMTAEQYSAFIGVFFNKT